MYFIGVDLGQTHDYTAIAVIQKYMPRQVAGRDILPIAAPSTPEDLLVRRLERIPLGTPYPRIIEHIRALTHDPRLAGRCALVVDATGLGAPVVDMLREPGTGCDVTAVTITAGNGISRRGHMHFGIPRRDLLAGVQLALEQGRLRISARLPEGPALGRELLALRAGHQSSEHDDLVFAVALACWRASRKSVWGAGRLPGF